MLLKTKKYEFSLRFKDIFKNSNHYFNKFSLINNNNKTFFCNNNHLLKKERDNSLKLKNISNFYNRSNNKYFYRSSKKNYLNKDFSHLHVETTDKIYPKIRKYEYDYDLSKTENILKEFNYLYEIENYDEALNKGYLLLNFFETNPKAKIQSINLLLILIEMFIKQEKFDIAVKLINKVENKLDLQIFKNMDKVDLYNKYNFKFNLLKAIIYLKIKKEKEAIFLLKEISDKIKNQNILNLKNIDMNIASDYLTLLLFQAEIYKINKYHEKYSEKIEESINFYKNNKSNNFDISSKIKLVEGVMQFYEDNLAKNENRNDIVNEKINQNLKIIEEVIYDIKNKKTSEEFNLRKILILATINQKDLNLFDSDKFNKLFDIINDLNINKNLKEEAKLKILNLSISILHDNLKINKDSNEINIENIKRKLFDKYLKVKNIMIDETKYIANGNSIIDNNLLSFYLSNFYQNFKKIKKSNFNEAMFDLIKSMQNPISNTHYLKEMINIINYNLLFLKNNKIIENLYNNKNDIVNDNKDNNINNFDKLNQINKKYNNAINFNRIKEEEILYFKNITDIILNKKFRSSYMDQSSLKNLKFINKFLYKEIHLSWKVNKDLKSYDENNFNSNLSILDDIIKKCLLFDNLNNKNSKNIKQLNKSIKDLFKISNKNSNQKLNRNINLNDINIDLFSIKNLEKELENLSFFNLQPKDQMMNDYRDYSEEEIKKIISTILILSNTYFRIAEENYIKLSKFFNNNNGQESNYFKNMIVIRNNIADKTVNYFSNFSLKILSTIYNTKNQSIKVFLNSTKNNDDNNYLNSDLNKLIVFNFLLKINTSLYFSNTDYNKLLNNLKENKHFLHEIKYNDRVEILQIFDFFENILKNNIDG